LQTMIADRSTTAPSRKTATRARPQSRNIVRHKTAVIGTVPPLVVDHDWAVPFICCHCQRDRLVGDSALEGSEFEPSVPRYGKELSGRYIADHLETAASGAQDPSALSYAIIGARDGDRGSHHGANGQFSG
jgi:hypothetical protein